MNAKLDAPFLARLRAAYPVRRRYLVGVSGGPDSVALLHLLHEAGFRKLVICHLNHRLRGRESTQDAAFVKRLAKRLGYEAVVESEDVAKRAQASRQSIETAAREARYAFFARVVKRERCGRLFLGHHADDQAETILMNFCRGAGAAGLAGMSEVSHRTVDGRRLEIIRPLLAVWREEVEAYLGRHRHTFRVDHTNQSVDYVRNRVRLQVIPLLQEAFGRDVRPLLLRTGELAREEEALIQALIEERLAECQPSEQEELSVPFLRKQPVALQRRVLREWLLARGLPGIGFQEVETVRSLIAQGARVAKVNLPGNHWVRRREKRLFVERPAAIE